MSESAPTFLSPWSLVVGRQLITNITYSTHNATRIEKVVKLQDHEAYRTLRNIGQLVWRGWWPIELLNIVNIVLHLYINSIYIIILFKQLYFKLKPSIY